MSPRADRRTAREGPLVANQPEGTEEQGCTRRADGEGFRPEKRPRWGAAPNGRKVGWAFAVAGPSPGRPAVARAARRRLAGRLGRCLNSSSSSSFAPVPSAAAAAAARAAGSAMAEAEDAPAAGVRYSRTEVLAVPVPPAARVKYGGGGGGGEPGASVPQVPELEPAAKLLRRGEVVAVPTETVYGLAGNALCAGAARKIFAAKGRPADNPLIVHVSDLDQLRSLLPAPAAELPEAYREAAARFWPGPLTIILPRHPSVPDAVTAGQPTVAVRMPAHPLARALIASCGFPLAAPSANASGRPSPTTAAHVLRDLAGRIPMVVDGGPCDVGVESTVLDALRSPPAILRPGGVTYEQLAACKGLEGLLVYSRDFVDATLEEAPTTPGMKYRHYSPDASVILFEPAPGRRSRDSVAARLRKEVADLARAGSARFVGVLLAADAPDAALEEDLAAAGGGSATVRTAVLGSSPDAAARNLFAGLREMDASGVDVILVEGFPDEAAGMAVMNRLRKAASRVVPP
ncbi:MAG: DHBP synthase RibB-like alpha/beta domain-containing protein [Olpidium bornovanus]|uniref:Threonylcarbamoyl-AMP synthase n=1 Tax=Olpidium bornovanus TaxID=278681 RepID=A0A8H7ZX30_9FUNG|nr:MAG: DHBP synthase RibB-like alpha/beta domain-containing protein [Olpidium bornovanus]